VATAAETSVPADAEGPGKRPAGAGGTQGWAGRLLRRFLTLREGSVILVTAVTIIYFAATTEHFATTDNAKNLLPYFAPFAILGAGQVFVMINGEIDLSIGAVYLLAPFIFQKLVDHANFPLIPAVVATILVCMLIGAINGFFVAVVGIASFVVTLGMLFALEGLTLVITHAQQVQMPGTSVTGVSSFAQVFGAGTYSELFWALAVVVVLQVVLSFTRWGLYTISVGGNRLGAGEAGINVRWNLIRNFVLCASLAGLVGILEAVRTTSASPDPSGANEVLFQGISAAVIGGTLLSGGSGTVVGALIGALFLGVLNDGLIIKGVNADYEFLYLGIAILIAMTLNTLVERVRIGTARV
jgi:simple sugar transport system permease protein